MANIETATKQELIDIVKTISEENRHLKAGINAVNELIENSVGVAGLHMNGDIASWGSLRTGGRFEEWLADFDAAAEYA